MNSNCYKSFNDFLFFFFQYLDQVIFIKNMRERPFLCSVSPFPKNKRKKETIKTKNEEEATNEILN